MNHERHEEHERIILKDESYAIQGAIFEVYREMGSGFLEAVYQECLLKEFHRGGIPFQAQPELAFVTKVRRSFRPTSRTSSATARSLSN